MGRRTRSDEDFDREIRAHLDIETDRLTAEGMAPADARRAAARAFGNVTRANERFYESRRVLWWDHLRQDVRSALRSIARTPVACAVAVASLAAGIGATTATLTIRNAVFYNPPPLYQDAQQLSVVRIGTPERPRGRVPVALYARWASAPDLQIGIAAAAPARPEQLRVEDRTETIRVRAVTTEFFARLGVPAALGRTFSAETALTSGPPPVVLSHAVWRAMFEGRADVLGSVVLIDRDAYSVIGVMPERFWFSSTDPAVWIAMTPVDAPRPEGVDVVVRRPQGLTAAALAERLQRDATEHAHETDGSRPWRVLVTPVGGTALGNQVAIAIPWLLGAAVILTLLIACANVAILMFARWTGRQREMAVRSCLGASRTRALALLLTESVLLAVCGGLLGICATFALRGWFVSRVAGAANYDLSIDGGILLQAALVTLVTGIVSGIAPAVCETRRVLANPLRLMAASDHVRQRWRHALVILEIAVTVALMVAAASQIDASRRMLTRNLGFEIDALLIARVEHPTAVDTALVLERIRLLSGAAAAAAASAGPMANSGAAEPVTAPGGGAPIVSAHRVNVGTDYFRTIGIPLRAGRPFTDADLAGRSRFVVVNETLAERLWPGRDALAANLLIENTPYEVIGVSAPYADGPMRSASPRFYLPLGRDESPLTAVDILVRATHDPVPLVGLVREEIRQLGGAYRVPYAFGMRQVLEAGAGEIMGVALAMSPLIGIGVFLTASGIFGVLAFAIARRSNELALRVALGATRSILMRLVLSHTFMLLAVGSGAGVGAAFAVTRLVRAAGDGGSAFDTPGWQAFAAPVLMVLVVGLLATWIPIRRAMAADPARLLRPE